MIWILAVSVCGTALSASAENTQTGGALTAAQTEQTTTLSDTETDADTAAELELFLPESYEQYLDLENPSDFAINEKYIAIADGRGDDNSVLFIYDFKQKTYKTLENAGNAPKSLCFYEDENGTDYLYYVVSNNNVYCVDLSEESYTQTLIDGFFCYSMIILGDTVFSARSQGVATIYSSNIDSIADTQQIGSSYPNCNNPTFAIYDDSVYLAANRQIYVYNNGSFLEQGDRTENTIGSFAVFGSNPLSFYYTSDGETLYDQHGIVDETTDTFSKVIYFNNSIYLLNTLEDPNNPASNDYCSIKCIQNGLFTDYEIGKYSDSDGRLGANASDISFRRDSLVIADTNNNRVQLINTENHTVNEISVANPQFVCAGDEDFIVSDSHYLYIYSYSGTRIKTFDADTFGNGTLNDCTFSYGKYYIIGTGVNGVLEKNDAGEYQFDASQISITSTGITADVYGNLYLLFGNSVRQYSEETFMTGTADGSTFYAPDGTLKILSDYAGKLYAATADGIHLLNTASPVTLITSDETAALVYGNTSAQILSFAFGFESGDVYILSDGFIVRAQLGTNAPASLNSIDADGLYDTMYNAVLDSGSAEDLLVNVPAGSVLLSAGSGITSSTAVFPYAGYERTDEARAGVRVCELDAGTVVAFYEYIPAQSAGAPPTRTYSLCLVLKNDSLPLESLAGYTAAETPFAGYTTHAIGLYRFPLLQTGGSAVYSGGTQLEHTQMVTVLGTISYSVASDAEGYGLDFDYYFVRVGSGDSAVYGFVPKNYIIDYYAPSSWDGEEFTFRYVRRGEEITLQNGGEPITLGGDTRVKVYGEPDENNMVNVTYTDADGNVWSGLVNADLLYEATPSVLIVLVIVLVVTAAVIVSTCYLILRKQPTLQ